MAGNGFCFISNTGEVYGCGFLPLKAGDVRQEHFKKIYQESPIFQSLRNYDLLDGRCGVCEYKRICGGCRARAYEATGDYLEAEPRVEAKGLGRSVGLPEVSFESCDKRFG